MQQTNNISSNLSEYCISIYYFGFNGKENDNKVKCAGNQQDYGMRIYDPRIGRFLSVAPLFKDYPGLTKYQLASYNPILNIDIDGLEGKEAKMLYDNKGNPTGSTSSQSNFYLPKVPNPYLKPKTDNNIDPRFYTPPTNGCIYPTPTNYERNFNFSVATETENMIKFDPVFRGVSTGTAAFTGIIAATPLVTVAYNGAPAATLKIISTTSKTSEIIQNAYYTLLTSKVAQIGVGVTYGLIKADTKLNLSLDIPDFGIPLTDVTSQVVNVAKGYYNQSQESKQNDTQHKQKEQSKKQKG